MAAPVFVTDDTPDANQVNDWFVNIGFVRKTADETLGSSATLQNDDHLFLSVKANAIYELTVELRHLSQAGVDFKFGLSMPAGATFMGVARVTKIGATTLGDVAPIQFTGSALGVGSIAAVNVPASVAGILQVAGTAGTLQFQWAQNTSNAAGTTVKTDSFMALRRVS